MAKDPRNDPALDSELAASYERAGTPTTFEVSCYTDPLGIEHLTGGLAERIRRFGTRADAPTLVRAEIWDPSHAPDGTALETPAANPLQGRCLALTNPIWYSPRR